MADFRDLLDGTTLSYSSGLAHLHPTYVTSISGKARGHGTFHMLDHGAVADGSTDDTAAFLAACVAAEAEAGNVGIPNNTVITEGYTFTVSNPATRNPVFVCGNGEGSTTVIWDPADLSDTFVRFYLSGDEYTGGGVRDLSIFNPDGNATGNAIQITGGFRQLIENVWVRNFAGSGGCGLKIDDSSNPAQHTHLSNVHLQICDVGMDITGVQEFTANKLCINQCATSSAYIRGGTISWDGGLVQGSKPIQFFPESTGAVFFRQRDVYYELVGVTSFVTAVAAPGNAFGGYIKISDVTVNQTGGSAPFADIEKFDIELEKIGTAGNVLKARNSQVFGVYLAPVPGRYDLDAFTQAHSTWIHCGNISIGTQGPGHPDVGNGSLTLAAPPKLPVYTTTERNTLTPETGWLIFNSTTGTLQAYNGASWV